MDMQALLNQLESCMQNLRGIPYIKVNKKSNFIANAKKKSNCIILSLYAKHAKLSKFLFLFSSSEFQTTIGQNLVLINYKQKIAQLLQ